MASRVRGEVAAWTEHLHAMLLHGAQVRPARDQHHVAAATRQGRANVGADGPGPYHGNTQRSRRSFGCERLGDDTALDLARRRTRNLLGDEDGLGDLEGRQPGAAIGDDLLRP